MSVRVAPRLRRSSLFVTTILAFTPLASLAHAAEVAAVATTDAAVATADDERTSVSQVTIESERAKHATGATGLDLSLRETPQSVTVIGRQQIETFALNDVNALLDQVVGVNVERAETDRTYYNSRGFDITNFQVDGVGLPLQWGLQTGDLDTAIYDRVEIVRGANGMLSGTGNPSATANYIRKRPTQDFQGSVSASYGSWDDKRLEADVSGPLNASGTVTGRLVYANEDKDSYLDYNKVNRNVYYGVLSWDVTSRLKATAGYSRQDNLATGVMWGSLPLEYNDGSPIDYPASASTSAPWTYWDTHAKNAFAEVSYAFDSGWTAKGTYNHKTFDENAKLLYAYGNPDPVTGLGVGGMVGKYPAKSTDNLWEGSISGPVELFGRQHQIVLGASSAKTHSERWEDFSETYPNYPALADWGSLYPAEPTYPGSYQAADMTDRLNRYYGAAHLTFTDKLKGVVGFNAIDLKSSGVSYDVDQSRKASKVSPYAGLVYEVNQNVSLYGSYTDIFNPQVEIDVDRRRLDPAKGESYEAGLKSQWFGGRLYATAAVFKSKQLGLATAVGAFPIVDGDSLSGHTYYAGVDTSSKGYELEVAGAITDQWRISGGWTQLSLKDADTGEAARTFIPRKSFKLQTTYAFPELRNLTLGAAMRWQSEISTLDLATYTQKAYAVFDLTGAVDVTDSVKLSVNVKNLFDKKYQNSLMWNQAFYAAPRNASVRLTYSF
jgi:outer membrane receptor for ferric coprogen and ferric-rhodotorulic acid